MSYTLLNKKFSEDQLPARRSRYRFSGVCTCMCVYVCVSSVKKRKTIINWYNLVGNMCIWWPQKVISVTFYGDIWRWSLTRTAESWTDSTQVWDIPTLGTVWWVWYLKDRRIKLSQSFFKKILSTDSCLHTLLPPERNNEIFSKLHVRNPLKYPIPYSKTKKLSVLP